MTSGIAHVDVGVQLTRSEWNAAATHAITYILIPDGVGHYLQLPQLTTAQRNALTPVNGMIIYNSTTSQVEAYQDGSWGAVGVTAHGDLTGIGVDDHHAQIHAGEHENGGGDEIDVVGLSGLLADDQHVLDAEVKAAAVSDTAYGVGWNGITDVAPSKNAVYDKIEAIGGVVFTDYRYYTDLAAASTYTPPAQAMATLLCEPGRFLTSGIHVEFYDGAGWINAAYSSAYQNTCSVFQDNSQNLRVANGHGSSAYKISLTGVTWS